MAGLIHDGRGRITVNDHPGLEAAACGCYALDRANFRLGMGFAPDFAQPAHFGQLAR